ncbi:hypothetical protein HCN44_000996 [Aphidius gifuensis]|uniref:Protein twisted gastrulation n=2 Tax=Aphidius gifuensis TaxID=684658 RepID=A0A834XJN8_APHGI|nr:hypothetical protein HCN44_000996 [Aphidius gifuensis]
MTWHRVLLLIGITTILLLLTTTSLTYACNEAICASVVSKCMLTQSCNCDQKAECKCCKECFACLQHFYSECCSCVDMCPRPNKTDNPLSKQSSVSEFSVPMPGLFQALTSEPDSLERWLTFTFPFDLDVSQFQPNLEKEQQYDMQTIENVPVNAGEEILKKPVLNHYQKNTVTLNCTVAFMAQCTSYSKCHSACQSMGASSYRWFHDGCCECVGQTCLNYGINESRCLKCPIHKEEDEQIESYDDYGQDDEEPREDND